MKKLLCALLSLLLLPLHALADGQEGSSNYLYTMHGEAVSAPPAYTLSYSLVARDYPEIDALDGLADAYVTDDAIYILCAKRLLILNHDLSFRAVLQSYTDEAGKEQKLEFCTGVTVTPNKEFYITQSEKSQILRFNPDYTLNQVMGRPEITGYENVKYRQIGRAYV